MFGLSTVCRDSLSKKIGFTNSEKKNFFCTLFSKLSKATSTQDLDPRPLANNDHPSILPFEMYAFEPGETPSRILKWSPLGFLSQIKRRTIGDRFPLSLWEVWFFSTLGVPRLAHHDLNRGWSKIKGGPIPALIGPPQWCACNAFDYDAYGDHL
jgi:hypothetical protein